MRAARSVCTLMSDLPSEPDMDNTAYTPDSDGLISVLRRLRAPDGCPWDRKQTRESLSRHLAGETGELLDAIDRNCSTDICDELGDVLMNIYLQILVAEEKGEFSFSDVWKNIVDKMIRRHEHIFGDAHAETPEDVTRIWLEVKRKEKEGKAVPETYLGSVKHSLSALERAEKLQKKASEIGFDWNDIKDVSSKVREEIGEVEEAVCSGDNDKIDEELSDLLFSVVNLIRFNNSRSSEELLRAANRKFERRFNYVEKELKAKGIELGNATAEQMETLWQKCKDEENDNA